MFYTVYFNVNYSSYWKLVGWLYFFSVTGIPGLCGLQMQLIARIFIFISYHNCSGDIHVCLYGCSAYFHSALQSNWSCKVTVAFAAAVWRLTFTSRSLSECSTWYFTFSNKIFFSLVLVISCHYDFLLLCLLLLTYYFVKFIQH